LIIGVLELFSPLTSDNAQELIEYVVSIECNGFTGEFFEGDFARLDDFAELYAYLKTS